MIFLWSYANFLFPRVFDHSPCVVETGDRKDTRQKPFRFFDMWTQHEDFLEVVKEAWNIHVKGDPLFRVVHKLKYVKIKLKKWNVDSFGRVDKKVELLCSQMFQIQEARKHTMDDGALARKEKEVTFGIY